MGTRSANSSIAATSPVISSTVSPLMRKPTASAAICAGVASPRRISAIAAAAWAAGRSAPAVSGPRTAGHPPNSSSVTTAEATRTCGAGAGDGGVPAPSRRPTPLALAAAEGELEARLAHVTLGAHALGRRRLLFGGRIEDLRIDAPAGRGLPPRQVHLVNHFLNYSGGGPSMVPAVASGKGVSAPAAPAVGRARTRPGPGAARRARTRPGLARPAGRTPRRDDRSAP